MCLVALGHVCSCGIKPKTNKICPSGRFSRGDALGERSRGGGSLFLLGVLGVLGVLDVQRGGRHRNHVINLVRKTHGSVVLNRRATL